MRTSSSEPGTALASLARPALDAAKAAGLDADALAREAELPISALSDPDGRVQVPLLLRLWVLVADSVTDPFFGLHAGERFVAPQAVQVVGYAARHSENLGDCYRCMVRFARLVNETSEIDLRVEGDRAILCVGPQAPLPPWPRCYAEMCLAAYLTQGRRLTGVEFPLLEATFQHEAPSRRSEYERMFGSSLRFSAKRNELYFEARLLALPLVARDQGLRRHLESRASQLLESLPAQRRLDQSVRTHVAALLGKEQPTIEVVAGRLGMSPRTLQRRLIDEDARFEAIVDEVRRATALLLINDRTLSLAEVASQVGYRDVPSFRAAFVRWTGRTPRDYRASRTVPR